jgi:hypothetical protein
MINNPKQTTLEQAGFVEVIDKKIKLLEQNSMAWMKTADSNQLFKYPKEHRQMAGDNLITVFL